jgi:putative transposase
MHNVKRRPHTPEQIIRDCGKPIGCSEGKSVEEVARHLEVSEQTYHRWRTQYGGMKADDAKRLRELERKNSQLKKLLAEAELDKAMLKEIAKETSDPEPSRAAVMTLRERFGVSERRACRVVGQNRSTQRFDEVVPDGEEQRLRAWLRVHHSIAVCNICRFATANDSRTTRSSPPSDRRVTATTTRSPSRSTDSTNGS